jgi:threonyl-tRNA synthetase
VRAITVDDGHIFCRIDQVEEEAKNIAEIIKEFYSGLGMWGNHWVSLSVRDPEHLEKYIGDEEGWTQAEAMLKNVSDAMSLDAKRMEGEAALYGPKLDFMFTDALGRERQLATIQIDFAMPKRFELEYTDQEGKKSTPVMIHRAILGSYERFMAILIEHYAGAFPAWLAPVQVRVLPVSDKHTDYAREVRKQLKTAGLRADIDDANESLGKKIRNAKGEKLPYLLVVGDKEIEDGTVTVEVRTGEKLGAMPTNDFIEKLKEEVRDRK